MNVPPIGACVRAVHDLRLADHARERKPARDRLREHDEIGLDAEVLHREHAARPAEPGLNLVRDEHDPVPVADRAQPFDESARSRDEAALAELRLEDDRRDVLGRDVRREHALERRQRGLRRPGRGIRSGTERGRPRAQTGRARS